MGYLYLLQDWLTALIKREQKGSSTGVWIFKLSYKHIFQRGSKRHDTRYKAHDWSKPTNGMDEDALADWNQNIGETLTDLYWLRFKEEARAAYRLARAWGATRYGLNKIGVCW